MAQTIKLAKGYSIPVSDYATQGVAILGIRDSGKSYTAMKVAEQLMDAGIPIIAFDPVGIWRFLKVPAAGGKGYPIVVAGGNEPDIEITAQTAPEIIRAAMKEGVSLVIDLYSMDLAAKSTWRKIVQDAVHILMYENKNYGPRHIFLEEAAEFIPQRLGPAHGPVYAEIEKLARMGRNASLGYTLINQRAEEVNKAILEICERSLLHKQVGKNSMLSLKKWFDVRQMSGTDDIVKSLSSLKQGECWVVGEALEPHKIQVLPKSSMHPNPRTGGLSSTKVPTAMDPGKFIAKMQKHLTKKEKAVKGEEVRVVKTGKIVDVEGMKKKIIEQAGQIHNLTKLNIQQDRDIQQYKNKLAKIKEFCEVLPDRIPVVDMKPTVPFPISTPAKSAGSISVSGLNSLVQKSGEKRMLHVIAAHNTPVNKWRIARLAGLSASSGSFGTYMASLKRAGFIRSEGLDFLITPEGLDQVGHVDPLPEGEALLEMWCQNIGAASGASRILRVLYEAQGFVSKADVADKAGLSAGSGSFGTYIATLKRNGLIITMQGGFKISEDFK